MIVGDQSAVTAFLSRPETHGGQPVRRHETHASVVFVAGDRALKMKRAVRFPYLDYSTVDQRRRFCAAEVAINRRTAPELYIGTLVVTRDDDGSLRLGGDGPVVEWLVEMKAFDQSRLLDRVVAAGRLDRVMLETIADAIADFHLGEPAAAGAGGAAAMEAVVAGIEASFAESADAGGSVPAELTRATIGCIRAAFADQAALLDARAAAGFVRRCHGDLHLRNIVLDAGDRPLLFDAIEFSDDIATIDVLYDVAFLVMDLVFRGLGAEASVVANRYLDRTGDAAGLPLLPAFLALRAAIRAHVDLAAAASAADDAVRGLRADAASYLRLAGAFLEAERPRLIAVGGLSGSGKSRLARVLAPRIGPPPGARVVRTDATRKRLAGVPLGTTLDEAGYAPEMTVRTYEAVQAEVRLVLAGGRSVIADGVYARAEERRAVAAAAAELGVPFDGLWLMAPGDVLRDRVDRRRANVSDADSAVVDRQLRYDLGDLDWHAIDAGGKPEETTVAAARILDICA